MKQSTILKNLWVLFFLITGLLSNTSAQGSNNNSYIFDGETGYASVLDGQPVTSDANQSAYKYFDNPSYNNDSISVEAWVYLIGDNAGVKMPIIYRAFDNGYKSFEMYVKDRVAYFSIGNGLGTVSTLSQPLITPFSWVYLAATYDGQTLKFYYGGTLAQSLAVPLGSGNNSGQGGLYVGKSSDGAFKGLIDEIRLWRVALSANNINNSGGNGNPSENIPSSLLPYLNGEWSFTEFTYFNGVKCLKDYSNYKNHLRVYNITEIIKSIHPPLFVVNSTGDAPDTNPGDGTPDAGNGQVTLRSAIMEANALAGSQKIYFYIPGSAPYIIQPGSSLPSVIDTVSINATTQTGYSGTPVVKVTGSYGNLTFTGAGIKLKGLEINNPTGYGLTLSSAGKNIVSLNKISGILINSPGNNIYNNEITNSVTDGIHISSGSSNNLIGVTAANNIHGNTGYGVALENAGGNQIKNNIISSNTAGGISVTNSTITISSNTISQIQNSGIVINTSSGDSLTQNTISGGSYGVFVNGSSNNYILQNNITGYSVSGVSVKSGTGNRILKNSIHSNAGLGIDLWIGNPPVQDGVTPNDANDADVGSNLLQNYPELNTAYSWPQGTSIYGFLYSTPSTSFKVQFFSNSTSTRREGDVYLGEKQVTTNQYGQATFLANLPNVAVNQQNFVSAIAYDAAGNTSEFSASIPLAQDQGLHYKVNTTLAGIPLHWADGKSDYHIAQSVVNKTYDNAVQTGFNTWDALNQLTYTRLPSSTEQWGGNPDGLNNVVWVPDSSTWVNEVGAPVNVIAATRIRYNAFNGELTDVDIAFNGDPISLNGFGHFIWGTDGSSNKLDIQNTATHEIGHYSGLADLYNPGDLNYTLDCKNFNQDATMYGRVANGETYKRTLMPDTYVNQNDVTDYDVGGINYIYSHLGPIFYDIVLVFDGSANFTSPDILNAYTPSRNGAVSLVSYLRIGDQVGIVNGSNETYPIGGDFNNKISKLQALQPNSTGNLAQRIIAAENLFSSSSNHKKVIILFSAGEINKISLITDSISYNPNVNIYTFGFDELTEGEDLMSWLANKTHGEYHEVSSSEQIPNTVNLIWLRLLGLDISNLSGDVS
ncbi:MAG TPA: LamG-like jellyroll fold domain-containing protein, partial [Ignavibacteriaceae bacterium]|nr:LamG-like jellyroll fold domain-containing protein [Ignavibacteriaceae bacterium]